MNFIRNIIKKVIEWAFKDEIEKVASIQEGNSKSIKDLTTTLEEANKKIQTIDKSKYDMDYIEDALKQLKFIKKHFDVGVDVHYKGQSWAVLSLQGKRHSYIKFIEFSDNDLFQIAKFLKNFENVNVDANPYEREMLMFKEDLYL